MRKILIMGLPGAGKTTLALALAKRLGAVHFNADAVRENINKDLGFSADDREEQARRMGWLCDRVVESGNYAIADFVCPTVGTRRAFMEGGDALLVFVDRIEEGRFADTNRIFERPGLIALRVVGNDPPEFWAEKIAGMVAPMFNMKAPTALLIGRYQPFHDGHVRLAEEAVARVGQVCIAVRDTGGTDEKNPLEFGEVEARIHQRLQHLRGQYIVQHMPNLTNVFYGRDVGYKIEELVLPEALQAISATEMRRRTGLGEVSHAGR